MKDEFKNIREVAEYLKGQGWKVSRATVYNHAKEGRLRADKSGIYILKAVQRYARLHLMAEETKQKIGDEELQRKKVMAEVAKITEQAKLHKLKREVEEGKYVLKEALDMEMAARAAILDAGLKYHIQAKVYDLIALVDGNPKKAGDLIREMTIMVDDALNDFATMKEFHVIIRGSEYVGE